MPGGPGHDYRAHRSGDHPTEQSITDLFEHQTDGGRCAGDAFVGAVGGQQDQQKRHTNPVVEPALDVETLADADRQPRVADYRLPNAASVGARMTPTNPASNQVSPPKSALAATVPNPMVSGSPTPSSRAGSG